MDDTTIWEAVGAEGFGRITAGFYRRVRQDDVLGPLYPENDWEGAEDRLRGFLLFRFGGVMDYVEERGHPRLRMRHMPFAIGEAERDRWIDLMGEAVREADIPREAAGSLMVFFAQVADFMRNR